MVDPIKVNWSFKGLTGTFDRASLQRGFQVYKEVCSKRAEGKFTLPTTIGAEKQSNLFMKCNEERVQAIVSAAAGVNTKGDPTATMKHLRELKNSF